MAQIPEPKQSGRWRTIAMLVFCAAAGCIKPTPIALHYVPDPAAQNAGRYFPAKVAVAPAQSPGVDARIGVIADTGGHKRAIFEVADVNGETARVIAGALAESGLTPVLLAAAPGDREPPFGIDFMILSGVNEMRCNKRFLPGMPPGTYRLSASVTIKLQLVNRDGVIAVTQGSSSVEEPPPGVDPATYQHTETDPGVALSQALSRAVRSALTNAAVVAAFPRHQIPSPAQD